MNVTEIYTSKKLETIVPEALIQNKSCGKNNPLGTWNATVFFVSHKKCILITNAITRYSVIIPGILKSDFENLSEKFINVFVEQLKRDNIPSKELNIKELIGEITLHKTNNNRPIIGTQKYILEAIDVWKQQYGRFENWDFSDINRRINGITYKQLGWLFPKDKMKILLEQMGED